MLEIGNFNTLNVLEITSIGIYLEGEVWLSPKEAPEGLSVGARIDVFVYYDADLGLHATLKAPYAVVGEFAHLEVTSIQSVGAFLDWGLPKELFLPFREQTRELRVGHWVIVYLYLDKSQRVCASMRTDKYLDSTPGDYREGERVNLFITSQTEMGYKAIINGRHSGLLYANEIFQPVEHGQRLVGFVRKLREDGRIDLSLQQTGIKDAENIGERILAELDRKGGFLSVGDKSSAEEIYDLFGVSKKKFKIALGGLLKKGRVTFERTGIRRKP